MAVAVLVDVVDDPRFPGLAVGAVQLRLRTDIVFLLAAYARWTYELTPRFTTKR